MTHSKNIALLILCHFYVFAGYAQGETPVWGNWPAWGDMGDGTFRNPVLPSDYSDIDCINVGNDYYAISSTFQHSPGMIIIHSKDLVNWTILGHCVPDVTQIGEGLSYTRMDRYGRGIWAGAIRYHKGLYYVYFGTPDEGLFMTMASNPKGPWEPLHCMKAEAGWDDCCPLFDDDGQVYFVATKFSDGYKTYLYQLTPDGKNIIEESKTLINQGGHREANKLYKINGTYYHFFSEVAQGGRYIMMQRASAITGPYTEKKQLSHVQRLYNEPNQGGLIVGPDNNWYFFTHHGTGDWAGRIASLLPVYWVNGWPIIGQVGNDSIGTMVWQLPKPSNLQPRQTPQSSDSFDKQVLSPQWEWNYHPRNEMWSLLEKPGSMRLKAFKPLENDNLFKAGNTLTQRCFRTSHSEVVLKINITGMANGQKAGLCHYSKDYAMLGISQTGNVRNLEFNTPKGIKSGPEITGSWLWIKSTWGLDGLAKFYFSTDGKTYTPLGDTYQLGWGFYRGNRIGIYSYNNLTENGFIDIEDFTYNY
jgi:beta-xylosidase